jgi:hypothetical protein
MRMPTYRLIVFGTFVLLATGIAARGDIKVAVEHNENDQVAGAFKFKQVPSPAKEDAAEKATVAILSGQRDPNGGELSVLNDGRLPSQADEPGANFFLAAGTEGGRLLLDLGRVLEVKQINTYSWHPDSRGPQVYTVHASDGQGSGFKARPAREEKPDQCGWKLLAKVDSRPKQGEAGGQYGVSISDSEGVLGKFRYLLFEVSRTEDADAFGNTFYSEIDVIEKDGTASPIATGEVAGPPFTIQAPDGSCEILIDTAQAPDLKDWAEKKLAPVLAEWYPRLAKLLASDGYTAPKRFSVKIRPGQGVAATGGTGVTANANWIKSELSGEAIGALLHEEVHVIQQYGRGRRSDPDAKPTPGWLVEAIPDYIRWFLYEPQSHGADIVWMRGRRNFTPRYDASYRVSANFLDYVTRTYQKDLVTRLNAACRNRRYSDDLWKEATGKTLAELSEEWKSWVQKQLAPPAATSGKTE